MIRAKKELIPDDSKSSSEYLVRIIGISKPEKISQKMYNEMIIIVRRLIPIVLVDLILYV